MTFDEFCKLHTDPAGWEVKVKGDWYLIGDVNGLGGCCDCCTTIKSHDIIEDFDYVAIAQRKSRA